MIIISVLDRLMAAFDGSPWAMSSGRDCTHGRHAENRHRQPLYTPEQRVRRDNTYWTTVQGILAPIQFLVFIASAVLVVRFLATGEGFEIATASVVAKTILLYAIMITGAVWEKVVFGCYLFAPAFYWEDVFSMLVLALHAAYVVALVGGYGDAEFQMLLALAAYAAYVVNATQFLLKLRAARLDEQRGKARGKDRAQVGSPIGSF
jgi:3-vinyl bacteriochlorophyllide hydratase